MTQSYQGYGSGAQTGAGGTYNVQGVAQQAPQAGGIGGLLQGLGGGGMPITGPNANAYTAQMNEFGNLQGGYSGQALGPNAYNVTGPQIGDLSSGTLGQINQNVMGLQGNLGNYGEILSGTGTIGSAAQNQFTQGLNASNALAQSQAASARGGPAAQAMAQYNAQALTAGATQNTAAQAAQMRAQQQQAALQGIGQTYGQIGQELSPIYQAQQQQAYQQAQLQAGAQGLSLQGQLGFGALGNQAGGQSLQALNEYTGANLQSQGLQAQQVAAAQAQGGQLVGAGLQAGTALATGGSSLLASGALSAASKGGGGGGGPSSYFANGGNDLGF